MTVTSGWPFGNEYQGSGVVVVASQDAVFQVELRDQPGQHPFGDLAGSCCGRLDQFARKQR